MQENNIRLIDEASQSEAVKNTFRLGWEFVRLNQKFTLIILAILIVLNFLGMIPFLSLIAPMIGGVLGLSLQIYAGRVIYESDDIENYVDVIKKSDISEVVTEHSGAAFGAYLGWVILLLAFIFTASIMAVSSGLITENMNEKDVLLAFGSIGLPLVLVALILSYVQPLVHSNIVLAEDFKEGFKAVFTIFSKDVWSSAMQKPYFSYVAIFGLLIMLCILPVVLAVLVFGTGTIFNLFVVIVSYILMITMSIAAMIARRIVEK